MEKHGKEQRVHRHLRYVVGTLAQNERFFFCIENYVSIDDDIVLPPGGKEPAAIDLARGEGRDENKKYLRFRYALRCFFCVYFG